MSSQLDYRAIRKRAEEQIQRDKRTMRVAFFVVNFLLYILFMIIAWGMFLGNGGGRLNPSNGDDPITGAMIMLSVIGFLGVMFQFVSLMVETKAGERQMRERAMGRALSEEMLRLAEESGEPQEKAKHMMQLSDDGELEAIVDEGDAEIEPPVKEQKRRNR